MHRESRFLPARARALWPVALLVTAFVVGGLVVLGPANEAAGATGQLKFHAAEDWTPLAAAVAKPEAEGLVV